MSVPRLGAVVSALGMIALASCGKSGSQPASPPPAPPPMTVDVAPVVAAPFEDAATAIGQVWAVDSVALTVKVPGIIRVLHLDDGQKVGEGALLAELDSAETIAALREAAAVRDNAALELKRSEPLVASGIVNANQIDDLRSKLAIAEAQLGVAQAHVDDRRVFAPFPGRLGLRQVSVGSLVAPGTVISTLTRVSPLKLVFSVPEALVPRLATGLEVRGRSPAFRDRVFAGQVSAIDAMVDATTHTIAVQALIPNTDDALKPGLSLDVELVLERVADALTVPEAALVLQGADAAVFAIADADGKATAKRSTVATGARREGRVRILSGLTPGTMVVIQGVQNLRDGMAVAPRVSEPARSEAHPAAPVGAPPGTPAPAAPAAGTAPAAGK